MTWFPEAWEAQPNTLTGKTILVTGAGDGIGRAAASAFASCGAEVLLLGRSEEKLNAVYDTIVAAGGATPAIIPFDLEQAEVAQYAALAEQLEATFPQLDGLLHNAALLGDRKSMAQTSPSEWSRVMQVNAHAPFLLTQQCLPLLQRAAHASVVFTSSSVGRQGRAFWGAYAVSKFATEGMMQVLHDEMHATSSIRFNSLNPGATNTAMRRMAYPAERPDSNPAPETLMPRWVYLMSDDSTHLSGQSLNAQK